VTVSLFLYGTLCHAPLRQAVLGLGHTVREARLVGYQVHWVAGADYPALVPGDGEALGLLVDVDDEMRARADFFEGGFGYEFREVSVALSDGAAVTALCYMPEAGLVAGALWSLEDWLRDDAPLWLEAVREAMAVYEAERGQGTFLGARWIMMKQRADTRLRAAQHPAPHQRRADLTTARDVEITHPRHPYTGYFGLADHDLRFRRFDGAMSQTVKRAAFIGGDAVTVLPWDPDIDAVLVVEQFRAGPLLRGDLRPWTLEPIAGRIDPGETAEVALRREAREEAGLTLGRLHHIANYYPTPGAVTEYLYSYVAEARLSGRGGEIGGMDDEQEDIRTHLIPREEMLEMITSGEAGTGPLIPSMFWLEANRARLLRR